MRRHDLSHCIVKGVGRRRLDAIDSPRWYRRIIAPNGIEHGLSRVSRDPWESVCVDADEIERCVRVYGVGVKLEYWIGNPLPIATRTITCGEDEITVSGGVECTTLDVEAIRAKGKQ